MSSVFSSLNSIVIRTLLFSIQFLFRIMFLEIGLTYMIICCWLSEMSSRSFIHSRRMTFSFVTVRISISYLIGIIFSLFSWVHVLDIIVILVPESISLSLVVVLSSSSRMVIERVIRFSSPNSFSFLKLFRFLIHRRLREWSSSI